MIGKILSAFGYEKRSYPVEYDPTFSPDVWGKATSPAGYLSAAGVLSNSSVAFRCIDLKATLLASVPFKVFHRLSDGGRERARNIPLARLIERPNAYMTPFELVELISRSLDLTGNFYARIEFAPTGEPIALHPIASHRVQIERTQRGTLRYKVSATTGDPARTLLEGECLHVKNASADGFVGQSPVAIARGALGLGLELSAAAKASAGKTIGGFVIQPVETNTRSKNAHKDSITDQARGAVDRYTPRILDPGVKFVPNQFSNSDAELLESRKLSNEDVSRVFGVPPASVGISQSVSYGSAAQAAQDLVTNTLNPLAARIEAAFERALLSAETQRRLFFEFELDGLLRADPGERWRSYEVAHRIKALSPNEIRGFENLPPYIGGDSFEGAHAEVSSASADPLASIKP